MSHKPAEILADGLARMGIVLAHEAVDRLARYFQELKKWNSTYNLVGKAPDQDLIEKHFLDSLTLLPLMQEWGCPSPLLDIGTGAGFPGLVLKAALPELQVTLLEPRQKRVAFLKHIVRTLGLRGVTILAARLEPEGQLAYAAANQASTPTTLPPHPVITSRAFTRIAGATLAGLTQARSQPSSARPLSGPWPTSYARRQVSWRSGSRPSSAQEAVQSWESQWK